MSEPDNSQMTTPHGRTELRSAFASQFASKDPIMLSASRRGIQRLADNTDELMAYDKLADRDKELLEKS